MSDEEDFGFKKNKKKIVARKRKEEDEGVNHQEEKVISASAIKQAVKKHKSILEPENEGHHVLGPEMTGLGVAFATSGTAASILENDATRTLDVDGHDERTSRTIDGAEEGMYAGLGGYQEFINKKAKKVTQSNAGSGLVAGNQCLFLTIQAGPLKGMNNVKIACRFDYAPAICKDYKETGFCGFGDSCVFMHDRGDYKQGWQLDLEWEEEMKRKAGENDPTSKYYKGPEEVEDEHESDDDLPFACLICRGDFKSPVVTKCKHYFCESCALKRFSKTPACFACNQNTQGVFNNAKEFKMKLEAKKKRMEERAKLLATSREEEEDDSN